MATIVFGGAMSHSPMMNYPIPKDHAQVDHFKSAVGEMGSRLRAARPDVLVVFGPDHFRTLFYDLMPAFTIGVDGVAGWGDWNTPTGPFQTKPELAKHILDAMLVEGFDLSFSYELKVDHGITQPLQLMDVIEIPLVPIVINSAGLPLPTPRRCHTFGAAVRRAITSFPRSVRVAIVASGGLSHDPPAPSLDNAIHGRTNGFAADRERETRLINNAEKLKSRINQKWDRYVLQHFEQGEVARLAGELTSESIFQAAGNGGQEIRTWIAMAGAMGNEPMRLLCYEPIDALITGMGAVAI